MGVFNLICLTLLVIGSFAAKIPENDSGKKWVVLLSGSAGWNNYRHQADICHAYQIMRQNGIPAENIITMMVDDIANNDKNPSKGKILNHPYGSDVYNEVVIDYRGEDVNINNFINVITGNKQAITGAGSGKVIEGGPSDNIFINIVSHGTIGAIGFPNDVLYVDELMTALYTMYNQTAYSKVLMYIEASEAGTMFYGLLPEDSRIMAITASDRSEESWGCYCDINIGPYYTCLGDLFSVKWMEMLDEGAYNETSSLTSVFENYVAVKQQVERSNVMVYGDLSIGQEKLSSFIGYQKLEGSYVPKQKCLACDDLKYAYSNSYEYYLSEIKSKNMRLVIDNTFKNIHSLATQINPSIKNVIGDFEKPTVLNLSLDMFPCYKSIVNQISLSCFSLSNNPYAFDRMRVIANLCIADKDIHKQLGNLINEACEDVPTIMKIN